MNKLCCCAEPELPDITVSFNCACCDSRVERRTNKDTTDLEMPVQETADKEEKKIDEEDKVTTCCCCFRRTRHAKSRECGKKTHDGGET